MSLESLANNTSPLVIYIGATAVGGIIESVSGDIALGNYKKFRKHIKQYKPDGNHEIQEAILRAYLQATLQICIVRGEQLGMSVTDCIFGEMLPRLFAKAEDVVRKFSNPNNVAPENSQEVFRNRNRKIPAKFKEMASNFHEKLFDSSFQTLSQNENRPRISFEEDWIKKVRTEHLEFLLQLDQKKLAFPSMIENSELNELLGSKSLLMQSRNSKEQQESIHKLLIKKVKVEIEGQFGQIPRGFQQLFEEKWFNYFCGCFQYQLSNNAALTAKFQSSLLAEIRYSQDKILTVFAKLGRDTFEKLEDVEKNLAELRKEMIENSDTIKKTLNSFATLFANIDGRRRKDFFSELRFTLNSIERNLLNAVKKTDKANRQGHKRTQKQAAIFHNEIITKLDEIEDTFQESTKKKHQPKTSTDNVIEVHNITRPYPPKTFAGREKELESLENLVFDHRNSIIVVSAAEGHGKMILVSQLIEKVAPGNSSTKDQRVKGGILVIKCENYERDIVEEIFDAIQRFPLYKEYGTKIERENLSFQGKCSYIVTTLCKIRNVWLVLDGLEHFINAQETKMDEYANLRKLFNSFPKINDSDRPKVIITSTVIPKKNDFKFTPFKINQTISSDSAAECLIRMAKIENQIIDLSAEESSRKMLSNFFDTREDGRYWGSLINFFEEFKTELFSERFVPQDNKRVKRYFEDTSSSLAKRYASLDKEEQFVWLALSIFRIPVPQEALEKIFSEYNENVDLARIETILQDSSVWIVDVDYDRQSDKRLDVLQKSLRIADDKKKFSLETTAKHFVFNLMKEATSLDNHLTLLRRHFHRKAAEFYEEQVKESKDRIAKLEHPTLDDLRFYFETIYHYVQSEQYDLAAATLSQIDHKYLIRYGYSETLIATHRELEGKIKNDYFLAQHFNSLGRAKNRIGAKKEAVDYGSKAYESFKKITAFVKKSERRSLVDLGNALSGLGEKSEAKKKFKEALNLLERDEDKKLIGGVLADLAGIYRDLGELDNALETCLKSVRERDIKIDKRAYARTQLNLGGIYIDIGEYSNARKVLRESLQIFSEEETYDPLYIGRTEGNLAEVLLWEFLLDKEKENSQTDKNLFISAADLFNQSIRTAREMQDTDSERRRLLKLGMLKHAQKKFADARNCYERVIGMGVKSSDFRAFFLLGTIEFQNDSQDEAHRKFQSSIQICKELLELSPEYFAPKFFELLTRSLIYGNDNFFDELKILTSEMPKGILLECLTYLNFMMITKVDVKGLQESIYWLKNLLV